MTGLHYHLLDVFTTQPYRGNPLAVFVDPPPLSDAQMQRIAGELNLSETVFTWAPREDVAGWHTRIFTPASEIPFAGHPTVGTACLLASLGRILAGDDGERALTLEEQVGPVAVTVPRGEAGAPLVAWLTVPRTSRPVDAAPAAVVAPALGIGAADLHAGLPVQGWSAGVPFTIVPVADLAALARVRVDGSRWERDVAGTDAPNVYVVTPTAPGAWRARMFAPGMGIVEDPATGAAVAAFSGYLVANERDGAVGRWTIEQGVEMGRASHLTMDIEGSSDAPVVRIGGTSVVLGEGRIAAPPE